jgi:hypothetical protein
MRWASAIGLNLAPVDGESRRRHLLVLGGLAVWMAYTRIFWGLRASHLVLPPCPFYALTGHPCPFCGGTRSFAYMWQGDLVHSARLYPLGPALFGGTVAAIAYLVWALVSRRGLRWTPRGRLATAVFSAAALALLASWILKLVWLGN